MLMYPFSIYDYEFSNFVTTLKKIRSFIFAALKSTGSNDIPCTICIEEDNSMCIQIYCLGQR